ncbi:MAG: hypothetical protein ACJARD_000256 [Alphaproteobacteria bacterium]|jgi:hypothetical protein
MAIKFKFISTLIISIILFMLYLTFFTPQIKQIQVSQAISLKALLEKN